MNGVLVKIWVGILLAAVGGYGAFTALRMGGYFTADSQPDEQSNVVELKPGAQPLPELADVKLIERSGANFRWSQLEGKPWVANIFYSTCQKECTLLSHQIRGLQNEVPGARFVSITCDPDRDTPDVLRKYAESLQADALRWFFVTGDMREIARASRTLFGFSLQREQHASYLALMDGQGRFVGMYDGLSAQSVRELAAELKKLAAADEKSAATSEQQAEQSNSSTSSDVNR